MIIYAYRAHKAFEGELILLYGFLYGIGRAGVEFYRAPDAQIGYIVGGWMTLGMALSLAMAAVSAVIWMVLQKRIQKL